ncbi:MAG: hypothetical protein GTO54_10575, partial [Nitrososphaeria archaeon]|nr:hypothetical protein [Nitrososphaeria archaeon]
MSEVKIGSKYRAPSYGKEIILTVLDDIQEDDGKNIARMSLDSRKELGVEVGEYVEVLGPRTFKIEVGKLEEVTDEKKSITISRDAREKIPVST